MLLNIKVPGIFMLLGIRQPVTSLEMTKNGQRLRVQACRPSAGIVPAFPFKCPLVMSKSDGYALTKLMRSSPRTERDKTFGQWIQMGMQWASRHIAIQLPKKPDDSMQALNSFAATVVEPGPSPGSDLTKQPISWPQIPWRETWSKWETHTEILTL